MEEKQEIKESPAVVRPAYPWESFPEESLLALKLCELGLRLEDSDLIAYVKEVYAELDACGLSFHPPAYLADEWFTPDGDPLIGVPFFLANPRLKKLEEKMCREVEGGTKDSFKRLFRHECGHAFNYAYLFHSQKRWQELFGPFSKEYCDTYMYRPYSKSFVRHLDNWYAQCHPDEDFAETFAVWLTPDSNWRQKYQGWKALEKLEYVDKIMQEIKDRPPLVKRSRKYYSIANLKVTLARYYQHKKTIYQQDYPDFHDSDLRKIFVIQDKARSFLTGYSGQTFIPHKKASVFLRRWRRSLIESVVLWTGGKKFIVERLLAALIKRCAELDLYLFYDETQSLSRVTAYVTSLVMNFLVTGSFKKRKR
jgi:hypothetical protein